MVRGKSTVSEYGCEYSSCIKRGVSQLPHYRWIGVTDVLLYSRHRIAPVAYLFGVYEGCSLGKYWQLLSPGVTPPQCGGGPRMGHNSGKVVPLELSFGYD